MLAWIDAACGGMLQVFGLTLVERHLQALKRASPRPDRVVIDLGPDGVKPRIDASLETAFAIDWRQRPGDFVARLTAFLAEAGAEPVLLLDGATLPDARLHAALVPLGDSVAVTSPEDGERAALIRAEPGRLAGRVVTAADLGTLADQWIADGTLRAYAQDEFAGFIRKLRRTVPYYVFRVDTREKVAEVEAFMFWVNYKGSTDFFTRYVYPPLVWAALGPLARARVHPNTVTIFSVVLALGAIPMWAMGETWSVWTGFLMAYGMSVLDSVDGKLARLTFTDSRLGNRLDHGLDMVHPPFWYLAWAYGIAGGSLDWGSPLGSAAVLVVVFYVVDRLTLKIYPRFFQRAFHTHSKLDGRVRTFIARRNITLPMFMVGYALGFAREAFYLVTAWQIVTALYHGGRTFWILVIDRAHLRNVKPTDVARVAGLVLITMMACASCAHYAPQPTASAPFLARAATQTRDGLRVAVAVPSDEESRRLFGVPLAAEGIQPVWLEVENGTERPYWFLPLSLDPAYFTPLEAANRVRYRFSARANEAMQAHFLASAMPLYAGPTQRVAGWVFTNLDQGVKAVIVELLGPPRIEEFVFMVPIPGLHADYHEVDHERLYGPDEVHDVNEGALRTALAALPCCATTEDGRAIEDPLNFVLIGAADEITPNLVRAGWHVTEVLKRRSALKTFRSYFFGSQYRYAPISPIYVFGRRQELSLQKARETARQRNHLRIWRAPLRFEGKPVWIGQISRDIGLSYNWKNIVGHEVDPDVDEARNYLVQDMLRSQRLTRFGWVKGVGESPPSAPRHMEDGTPFFTDGLRAVMMFTTARTPLERIRLFEWEKPPPR